MDGLTLARQLRAANAYLPIIMVTSVGDEMPKWPGGPARRRIRLYHQVAHFRRGDPTNRRPFHPPPTSSQARMIDEQREELENFASRARP